MTVFKREELVEAIAKMLDEAIDPNGLAVKDGDLEPIYELIKHYEERVGLWPGC